MAKKKHPRIWWYPMYIEEARATKKAMTIKCVENDAIVLFSDQRQAYHVSAANRFEAMIEDGIHVVNDEGYGQLIDRGRITMIAIKGKSLNWKQVEILHIENMDGQAIAVKGDIVLDQKTYDQVLEESLEAYHKHLNTPLARAGGLSPSPAKARSTDSEKAEELKFNVLE